MDRDSASFLVDKRGALEKSPFPLFVETLAVTRPYPLHHHNFSEITVVLRGDAEHRTDDLTYHAAPGDVFLVTGNRNHCFSRVRNLTVTNVQYMEELLATSREELRREPGYRAFFELEPAMRRPDGLQSHLTLPPADLEYVAAICREMERETRERRPAYVFLARTIFVHLCGFLGRCYSRQPDARSQSLSRIGQALNFIDQRYATRISVPELAALARMSESAFLRNFKAAMRRSPVDYIVRRRVEAACRKLAHTELSVTDVAMEVGFNSIEYFSRKFREIMHASPREYRKRCRETPEAVGVAAG